MSLPNGHTAYTCEITILRVFNVPISDFNSFSSDPYIYATLSANYVPSSSLRHQRPLTFRTHTERRTLNPVFNEKWLVSGIPSAGFTLSLNLIDEDPGNHDDRLGKGVHTFPSPGQQLVDEWSSGMIECKVHKRKGSLKSKFLTYGARIMTRGNVDHHCRIQLSVKVLGRARDQKDPRVYTLGPQRYFQHFSPILGFFLGSTKAPNTDQGNPSLKPSTFVANRLQLTGPVPDSLHHRYVGFAPFIKAMFKKKGIEGIILHRALHKQHCSVYKWDKNVIWGVIEDDADARRGPSDMGSSGYPPQSSAIAHQFLRMTSYGTHGRVFTYVIMLDGEMRFTETGENFAIELLSKHTMHSDIAHEIAYSGEFFVRQVHSHGTNSSGDNPPNDPSQYELVIDNDSGTYRPQRDLLPVLHLYLSSPSNLGSLGKINTMDGFDKKLRKWKKERAEMKKNARQETGEVVQAGLSMSSSSSSDSSSISVQNAGLCDELEGKKVGESQVQKAIEEDVKRVKDSHNLERTGKDGQHIVKEGRNEGCRGKRPEDG